MVSFKFVSLLFIALNPLLSYANQAEAILENEEIRDDDTGTNPPGSPMMGMLKVAATAAFEDSDIFGVNLVNGKPTTVKINIVNAEAEEILVHVVGGSLYEVNGPSDILSMGSAIRNLSSTLVNRPLPAASNLTFSYKFENEMHPQDATLILAAIIENSRGQQFQVTAFNGTVNIVEAPFSILDPQVLFLYIFLAVILAGILYFIYTIWLKPYIQPAKAKGGRKTTTKSAKVESSASTTGSQYDESWIPQQHLQRPDAKRSRSSGAAKSKTK